MQIERHCERCGKILTEKQKRFCSHSCQFSSHGMTGTPEHRAWLGMLTRCYNQNRRGYKNYGGRGIRVCAKWRDSFPAFLADVGKRPGPGYSLERIENNDHYRPGNVKWATRLEQAWNTRAVHMVTIDGQSKPLAVWSRDFGVSLSTVRTRIKSGHSIVDALTLPASAFCHPVDGENNPHSKLSRDDVEAIRKLRAEGNTYTKIGQLFDISVNHARSVALGMSWSI